MIAQVIAALAAIGTFTETQASPSGEVTGFTGGYESAETDTESNAESDAESNAVSDTESNTVSDAESNAVSNAESNSESKTDSIAENTPEDNAAAVAETDYSGNSFYLPETGGIGVEPFYIVGGIIVVTSAVLLIARFRSKK